MESTYSPYDLSRDGVVDEMEQFIAHNRMSVEERQSAWIQENLTPKGYSADLETGEIISPQGQVVGRLPSFE